MKTSTVFSCILICGIIWYDLKPNIPALIRIGQKSISVRYDLDNRKEVEETMEREIMKNKKNPSKKEYENLEKEFREHKTKTISDVENYRFVSEVSDYIFAVLVLNLSMIEGLIRECGKMKLFVYIYIMILR